MRAFFFGFSLSFYWATGAAYAITGGGVGQSTGGALPEPTVAPDETQLVSLFSTTTKKRSPLIDSPKDIFGGPAEGIVAAEPSPSANPFVPAVALTDGIPAPQQQQQQQQNPQSPQKEKRAKKKEKEEEGGATQQYSGVAQSAPGQSAAAPAGQGDSAAAPLAAMPAAPPAPATPPPMEKVGIAHSSDSKAASPPAAPANPAALVSLPLFDPKSVVGNLLDVKGEATQRLLNSVTPPSVPTPAIRTYVSAPQIAARTSQTRTSPQNFVPVFKSIRAVYGGRIDCLECNDSEETLPKSSGHKPKR